MKLPKPQSSNPTPLLPSKNSPDFLLLLQLCMAPMEHTHTHNCFTALLESVRDYLGEQVPER